MSAILRFVIAWACLLFAVPATAKEVHSNGLGGGRWSDTTTWRGGAVPTSEDDAVIAARDTVLFDRDDTEKPTCKQLLLDPKSNFAFQSGLGRRTLTVDGPIELYGSLKMHAPAATDAMEIRLVSKVAAERAIKLQAGGAMLILGRADLPAGKRNASIVSPIAPTEKLPVAAEITGIARTMIDIQNALLENVHVSATAIDNTGAKPNERCNFSGNLFTGLAHLTVGSCDTPAIVRNEFTARKGAMVRPAAIAVGYSPLAEIRGNRVVGAFAAGLSISYSECSATENRVEDCPAGITWHGGTVMLKQNVIRNCATGLNLRTVTGSAEDTEIDKTETPITLASAKVQLNSVNVLNHEKGEMLSMTGSSAGLLNCNIPPAKIKITPAAAKPKNVRGEEPVEALEFLVVGVTGKIPPRTQVAVTTANPETPPAPGAADLNIRNSPAALRPDGLTPLPQSLTPLVVKSWRMEEDGTVVPAPEYNLSVWEPATEPGAKPRVLKTLKIKPDDTWHRAKPNDLKPTMEVKLP